jgi:uncharacterized DUF497 family protein
MKIFEWEEAKNRKIRAERNISFEDIVFYIGKGNVIDIVSHPNNRRYPNQRIFVVDIDNYIYLVPFVESKESVFLKTIIPSRKATKEYLKR